MNLAKRAIKAALFWKIGVPAIGLATAFFALIFLPVFMVGGAGTSDGNTGDVHFTGVGISDSVPEEYRADVLRAGTICPDVTPAIIAAQIEAESNWNPAATSPVGAAGIAQFMPATWATKGLDGDGDGRADIRNPKDAIWSQGNYMCELRQGVLALSQAGYLSGATIDLTLASYNAGLGNVQSYRGVPPFTETRNYITRIKDLAAAKYAAPSGNPGTGSASIVQAGMRYLGRPYRAEGPGGIDCCVFVQSAVRDALGIELPMFTPGNPDATAKCEWSMQNRASEVGGVQIPADLATLQPGDLLFHQSTSVDPAYDSVTHVSIYIGNGQLIDSAPGVGVAIHSIDYYSQTDPILPIAVRFVLAA
ncbi:MAG: transglycosylase SLT domain-containing protein [Ancrocorticia sp.]